MPAIKLKWSNLLRLSELEFIPEAPKVLTITDELLQSISWLTAATGFDRRLLRCTKQGALLIDNAWSLLASVETDELYPESSSRKTYTHTVTHKGVLIATSTQLVLIAFYREDNADYEAFYLPANCLYFYPHKVHKITVETVPYTGGIASYVGVMALN